MRRFKDKRTEQLFHEDGFVKGVDGRIMESAKRKLLLVYHAPRLDDLRLPPGNRLEALTGDRKGQWSIRINKQWRLCFRWHAGEAVEIELADYH